MATNSSQTVEPMPWMKLYAAEFILNTHGLPLSHIGAYIRLMILYWSSGNTLPENHAVLLRKIGASNSDEDTQAVAAVLDEFFPMDQHGVRHHHGLDAQLSNARAVNERKSAGMKRVWQERKGPTAAATNTEDF